MWTKQEISSLLTKTITSESNQTLSDLFCYHYGVGADGNVDPYQVCYMNYIHCSRLAE